MKFLGGLPVSSINGWDYNIVVLLPLVCRIICMELLSAYSFGHVEPFDITKEMPWHVEKFWITFHLLYPYSVYVYAIRLNRTVSAPLKLTIVFKILFNTQYRKFSEQTACHNEAVNAITTTHHNSRLFLIFIPNVRFRTNHERSRKCLDYKQTF